MPHAEPFVHHPDVAAVLRDEYAPGDVARVADRLRRWNVFELSSDGNGLYKAVQRPVPGSSSPGYARTWVRDTVHVANAAWEAGQTGSVRRTAAGLLRWFAGQRPRFEALIEGRADPSDKMSRPHIRFDGVAFAELDEPWPHHQNDALGYALWFLSRAVLSGFLPPDEATLETLALFPRLFEAVGYDSEADSGHWEETPKLQCSSVGVVVAGLRALSGLGRGLERRLPGAGALLAGGVDLVELRRRGEAMLAATLPWESRDPRAPGLARQADAALLFLIEPLKVVTDPTQVDAILAAVREQLTGPYGIRRYTGDSYWMADYTSLFDEQTRTSGFEDDIASRDRHLQPGTEAQWCLFDPLLSTIHGWRYVATRDAEERRLQVHHLHRALGQITGPDCPLGEGLCPEAYYLEDSARPERWVANDDTPLLWTQAQVVQAVCALERSAGVEA